jgi:hypothetical protein
MRKVFVGGTFITVTAVVAAWIALWGSTPTSGCPVNSPGTYQPGTADPWGGCFANASNTGVPAGTTLTNYTGPCTVSTANTTIDSKTINCEPLLINTSGVSITKSQINGQVAVNSDSYPNPYSFTITDSRVVQPNDRASVHQDEPFGIGKSNFTATRVHVTGGIRGVWCEYNCTLRDSYIHAQAVDNNGALACTDIDGTKHVCLHESGARQGSGPDAAHGQNFIHNTWTCDAPDVADPNPGGTDSSGCSATLTGYGDFATIQYNTVTRNLFLETEGGVCIYGGGSAGKPFPNANHQTVTENIFHGGSDRLCGWGFTSTDWRNVATNTWSSNSMWDGTVLVPNWGFNR